jgi:hypothetical protein
LVYLPFSQKILFKEKFGLNFFEKNIFPFIKYFSDGFKIFKINIIPSEKFYQGKNNLFFSKIFNPNFSLKKFSKKEKKIT